MSAMQHLAVTLLADSGSSGHSNTSSSNMVDSPTSETSPSLRAPSTDPDCERYRSSPSTSFTSAGDSDGELDNSAVSSSRGKNNTAHLAATRQTQESPPPSRTWKMPFAKGSAPPRASPSSSPIGGLSSSHGSPQRRRKASTMARTLRSSVGPQTAATANNDSSFVETTSEKAALALAKYWNDVQAQADAHGKGMSKVATAGNDYVVVARVENGKRIYKIRPRSRPSTLADATSAEGHVQPDKLKAPPATATLQMPPSIRLTRSIPNLRMRNSNDSVISPINRDKDGFYRPAGSSTQPDNAFLTLPVDSMHHLLRVDDTIGPRPRKNTLQTAASIPNLRAHREQDVFGKLLGWSTDMPASARQAAPVSATAHTSGHIARSSPAREGDSQGQATPVHTVALQGDALRTPVKESFPYQLAPALQEASRTSIESTRDTPVASTSSPFGQGVRLPSQPRLKRKKSLQQLHGTIMAPTVEELAGNRTFDSSDSFDTSMKIRSLREVGSSETIRTAKGPAPSFSERQNAIPHAPESPRTPLAVEHQRDAWMSDTRIFDALQYTREENSPVTTGDLRDSLKPYSGETGRRHERGMSNTSLVSLGASSTHSINSATSAGEQAHTITVTSVPGDDRRFVIWGQRPGQPVRQPARPTSNARMSPASFASTSASSLGSSKRSSNHRKFDTTEQLTPPTSASSPSSPWSNSIPVQKVLLAATIDRWIADMTSRIENDLMTDFFLTYRAFLSPLSLCKLLITRFEWALQPGHTAEDIAGRRIVRVRTYVVIRHWLLNYFHEDFVPDRELRVTLTAWLNRMGKDERLRPNPTDLRLIKSLKKVVKRLKAAYSTIGVDQAVDANNLIKTSLEADPLGNTRSRSNSMASVSSLHSIREEQSEPTTIAEIISSTAAPASAIAQGIHAEGNPAEKHLQRNDIRTSSSEDDVDLEIEMHLSGYDSDEQPRIPPIIPISPPRARHHSPIHQRKSRSPQLGSYERSPKALDGLPIIADNHRVSRAIASTVGSFSKLRRMMGNRQQRLQATGNTAPQYNLDISSDMDNKVGAIRMEANDVSPAGVSLTRSVSGHPNKPDPSGLGIYNASSIPPLSESSASAASSSPDLRHSASSGTMRRKKSNPNMLSQIRPSGEASSLGTSGVQGLAPAATIRVSGIQLDDCDSSGDESNYGERRPLRTLRRLPAARDLRGGNKLGHNPLIHRHSIDSIASYATRRTPSCALEPIRIPSIATYDSNSSAQANDLDAMLDQGLVPFFVPPVDSEEEDEPGDVEAALRRLEGQVDDEKQRSNARKVEKYLKLSEEAKSNGAYVYGEGDDVSDEEDTTSSRAESVAVAVVGDDAAETAATADMPVAAEAQSQSREDVEVQHAVQSSQEVVESNASLMVPVQVPEKDAGKRTLQRKSSVRRFFGSTMSVSLWPMNSAASRQSKSKPQEPIYRSFLFSHKVDALARHFCIIERDLLEKVTWQELIGSSWRERLDLEDFTDWDSFMKMRAKLNSAVHEHGPPSQAHSPPVRSVGDVQTIIHRFNLMCRWIASEIVLTTSTAERAVLLTKIIRLAFKSYQMYNFQTVTQIVHALQLPSIDRLKKTWSKVPSFETRLFSQLKFFCSPLRDFRLLREATGALALQWGPPGQEDRDPDMALQGIPGALPFFGLILRDLAISNELPTYLDPSSPRAPAVIDTDAMLLPEYADPAEFADLPPLPEGIPLRPLINIHKYRTIARTIQLVMTYKELAATYPYEPELPLYRMCLTIQCLPMQKIVELSSACER